MSWWSSFWDKVSGWFHSEGGLIVRASLANVLETIGPVAADILFALAASKVKAVDQLNIESIQKHGIVKKELEGYLAGRGLTIAENIVNMAITHGVQKLREEQGGDDQMKALDRINAGINA